MRGQPYDVALDRVRRLVNERRFALGVQLIDRAPRPARRHRGLCTRRRRRAHRARPSRRRRSSRSAHGRFAGGELVVLGARPARRPRADPRLRPRPHLSARRAGRRRVGRRQAARRRPIISTGWPAGSRRRSACRPPPARSTTSTPGFGRRARRACSPSRSTRSSLSARARPGRGSIWRCAARGRCSARTRRGSRRAAIIGGILRHAARPGQGRAPTRRRCAPTWSAHKPPPGPLDIKLGPGGLVDLEFAVHVLQLDPPRRPRPAPRSCARGARRAET